MFARPLLLLLMLLIPLWWWVRRRRPTLAVAYSDARQFSLEDDWEQIEQWALQNKREKEFTEWLSELRKEIPVVVKVEL